MDGAFPEGFYSTTNQRTKVRLGGEWLEVTNQEMDCGLAIDPAAPSAACIPMSDVKAGALIVVGHAGVRVFPEERSDEKHGFEFMSSAVSTEKPKGVAIRQTALELFRARASGEKTLLVGGPAIVHTGSVPYLSRLIRDGYIQVLLAGNALATHDIEQALFGTSLGVRLDCGDIVEAGHEHHLRAINLIRKLGSIKAAVRRGLVKTGIMAALIRKNIPYVLAGSIRDDGPLPEVITDVLEAQRAMRRQLEGVEVVIMLATTLHSVAVGNLLPARVRTVCVDMNPSSVTKLSDRGTWQSIGLVTDVGYFLRQLRDDLTR
jgi:lysine-ketoglutarate reductase/saccharopine dehydrogenase-like protein (TIGR00300 family)